ncbi:hypothetical protein [Neisseria perflava]|uniref:hypothetical protein n=1 Tax=Neisseria perflava TaxID=33053 RepID=UPI0020A0BF82|nr:hypothetical protein [Neisseria perflava]MCP1659310.1 hypothetical protein [Neisseria perflava]MCP1772887.1 hypothetical protein [Neisseria perflava]
MNTRCPNCGAVHSLDSLISDSEAAEVLKMLLEMDVETGKAAVRYAGLFRPAKSQLSWGRTAKILNEMAALLQSGDYPPEAWLYGLHETLAAREAGRLKTPLKSHGYLCGIVKNWPGALPSPQPSPTAEGTVRKPSQTLAAAAQLEGLKR